MDLITYRLLELEPMEVEESAIPCGGKCGWQFREPYLRKDVSEAYDQLFPGNSQNNERVPSAESK